jgi:LemA protein
MTVLDLNVKIEQFPSSVVARFANAQQREFFELEDEGDRAVPSVSFGAAPA